MTEQSPREYSPRGHVWHNAGVTYLARCPECGTENYAMNVCTGICYRCRYDANNKVNNAQFEKEPIILRRDIH